MDASDAPTADLRAELERIVTLLAKLVEVQRHGGRTQETDALRGIVIEEGEVEWLLSDLTASLQENAPRRAEAPAARPASSVLDRALRAFALTSLELDALLLSLAVELDGRFARVVAFLNDHTSRTRPTVGLVLAMTHAREPPVELCEGSAVRQGLLMLEGEGPLPGLALRVSPLMLPRLLAPHLPERLPDGIRVRPAQQGLFERLLLSANERQTLSHWLADAQQGKPLPLLVAGPRGAGRATRAQAISSALGRAVVEVAWQPERPERLRDACLEARWRGASLLVRIPDDGPLADVSSLRAMLAAFPLPVLLTAPPSQIEPITEALATEPFVLRTDPLTIEQREALWAQLLPKQAGFFLEPSERKELAARFDFLPGTLARAARRAASAHEVGEVGDGREGTFARVSHACRSLGAAGVGPTAQRLPQPFTREDLVLPPRLFAELDLAKAWYEQRRRVFEDWGLGRRITLGRGLTALFGGPPGTGKTMAAQVLARELGLELFRVDLSQVMSKYIGETEKNLAQLFDQARRSGAMLFFDEADSLFGKRTQVKDAHDRYANLEIGYLLQRIEEHEGATVLATNRMRDLDEAFVRRFYFILDFPMPQAPERLRIWQGLLPKPEAREQTIPLETLAQDYEVSGGEIRNSVLSAAFMAASEGAPLGLRHLERGLLRELLKSGRVLSAKQRKALGDPG